MEKSVLLDKIKDTEKLFNEIKGYCGCFEITEATQNKLNGISDKFKNTREYVENTNMKKETMDKLDADLDLAVTEIKSGNAELNHLLLSVLPGLIRGTDILLLETIIGKDTKGYSAEAKKLLVTKDGEKKLTKKATAVIKKYQDKKESTFTPEEIETFKLVGEMLAKAYKNDIKLEDEDRLSPIPIDQAKEGKVINEVIDKINAAVPNKRKKGNVVKVGQQSQADAKKTNKGLKAICAGALALITAVTIFCCARSCSKNKPGVPDKEPAVTSEVPSTDVPDTTSNTDYEISTDEPTEDPERSFILNDEKSLDDYAKFVQDELKKIGINKSAEEIKNAIKLVNVDYLDNKAIFTSFEDFTYAVEDAGLIANKFGTGAILVEDQNDDLYFSTRDFNEMVENVAKGYDISNLNLNKTSKGYRLFNIVDQLMYIIENKEGIYSEKDIQVACDIFNEVAATKEVTHRLAQDKKVGPDYLLEGMWLNKLETLRKYTENKGNIYGIRQNIDGHSGATCFNAMEDLFRVGNRDNALYQDFFVNKLVNSQAKSLKKN